MKINILKKPIFLSCVILVGNALLGYGVYRSYQRLHDSDRGVRHSEQVIDLSGNLLSMAQDIETFSRAFVVTHDSKFIESLKAAEQRGLGYMAKLRRLTHLHPGQQRRLDSLDFYMFKQKQILYRKNELETKQVLKPDKNYASIKTSRHYTDRIWELADKIQQRETTLLTQRKLTNKRRVAAFTIYCISVFILMVLFTILLFIATEKYFLQNKENEKRAAELVVANKELAFQNKEKEKRAAELDIANKELAFQNKEKERRAEELTIANKELAFQNEEKEKRASELTIANEELAFENKEKEKRAAELVIANKELAYQNEEKEKRAAELVIANSELAFQNKEKGKRADELTIANNELAFQNEEKEKRAAELMIANRELAFQNEEKEKRASELTIVNKELAFENVEKEKRAAELVIANKELAFQNKEKEKRAAELTIANEELAFQNEEKERRAEEKKIAEKQLEFDKYNLDALINNTNDLMWSVDTEFNLITYNQPFDVMIRQLSGKTIARGRDILSNRLPNEKLVQLKEFYVRAFAGESFTEVVHTEMPHDSWSEISYYPIRKGDVVIGTACFSRDITQGRLADIERTKITSDLSQRNKDLEQFAYIVSHNLRSPVANILGAARGLNYAGLTVEKKEVLRLGLNESVMKLDDVIKDLNAILQIKRQLNQTKEMVTFSKLTDDIKISIKNLIDSCDLEIKYDFSAIDEFLSIKSYLYSIFYNLISNSIKYRQKQLPGFIKIKSRLINDKIELVFTDNGMGIDLEKKGDQVFGLYKRFHTNIEGKGMGLFMVKTQVETLGGRISIRSEVNKGTEFKIEF